MKKRQWENPLELWNHEQSKLLAEHVSVCEGFWTRLCGLIGKKEMSYREVCWITACRSIHTFGMNFPIDAYFLDKKNYVIAIFKALKPNRVTPLLLKADSVLEFKAGVSRDCQIGDQLVFKEARQP